MAESKKVSKRDPREKKPMGRPRVEFDLEQVRKLAMIGATHEEIAMWFGTTADTVKRRKKDWAEFCTAIQNGHTNFRMSIRREQYAAAKKGNITMLIWLGKQVLGQRDRSWQEVSGEGGKALANVTFYLPDNGKRGEKKA